MKCKYCLNQINKLTRAKRIVCPCNQTGVHYCDKVCQGQDWAKGGHKQECDYYKKLSQLKSREGSLNKAGGKGVGKSTSRLHGDRLPSTSRSVERESSTSRESATSKAATQDRNVLGRFEADVEQQTVSFCHSN